MEALRVITRRVLVVGRNAENRRVIDEAIRHWKFETVACSSLQESGELIARQDFAVAFCEERREDVAYRDFLGQARRSRLPVIVLTPLSDQEGVFREALALGATDILPSPCSPQDVQWMVIWATQNKAATRRRDATE